MFRRGRGSPEDSQYIEPVLTVPTTFSPLHGLRAAARGLRPCEVCQAWGGGSLCADCRARFAAPRLRCARCALVLGSAAAACGACQQQPPPFARTVCAVDYAFPWSGLVAAFKFRARPELARPMAELMAELMTQSLPQASLHHAPLPQYVLPVPLSPARLAERGYDQAWELARALARRLGLPAENRLLQRLVDGERQSALGRAQRQQHLAGAFLVDPLQRAALAGRHVALVDDVMTTGATLREAAHTLLRAGAAEVSAWVFARTPAPAAEQPAAAQPQA